MKICASRQGAPGQTGEALAWLRKRLPRALLRGRNSWGVGQPPCSPRPVWLLLWACLILLAAAGLLIVDKRGTKELAAVTPALPARSIADTLVIYVFSDTDPEYEPNLAFFIRHGMWEGDGCDYLIILQQDNDSDAGVQSRLPPLPPSARVIYHENRCFDWGTFGWALRTGVHNTQRYRHFIFMNSSVRGPFLPAYWPADIHWSRILTSRLTGAVKLVGATISCQPTHRGGDVRQELRASPHVQSYLAATDKEGLEVLLADPGVFACHDSLYDAIWHAELGASAAMLKAGFNLDCLQLAHQGVDWRHPGGHDCDTQSSPYQEFGYSGMSLHPLEVLFVKVKASMLDAQWPGQAAAVRYQAWLERRLPGAANRTAAVEPANHERLGRVLVALLRGPACFDSEFYMAKSYDLTVAGVDPWQHWATAGQFEGRPYRFTCPDPLDQQPVADAVAAELLQEPPQLVALGAAGITS